MPQLSIWEKESFFAPQDVIIIGCGFSGLWSALRLKELYPERTITILERGSIPVGASTRNAGFSCFGSPTELISNAEIMGEEKMWQLVAMRYKGLLEIRKYFTADEIDYDASGGYECFADENIWNDCIAKLDWLNEGLKKITQAENTFQIVDDKISELGFQNIHHLIENKFEGGLHPGKLVQALIRKVQSMGVQIIWGADVLGFVEKNNEVEIETSAVSFTAKQLLVCINAFTKDLIPEIDIIPNRGQVLITAPIPALKIKGTFHFDRGYYYFRNVGNRLLLGGGRNKAFEQENTTQIKITDVIQHELEHFIKTYLLPNTTFAISDRWSGIMAMGSETLPIVKAISNNVFCCVRMSGMGVALTPIVAKEVAKIMK